MTNPDIVQCPDQHYPRAIYRLGPHIADYPEQVVLAGIISGWCPKYVALVFAVADTPLILIFSKLSCSSRLP